MKGQFAQEYLGISEVLAELRPEFPDIRVSKIRFLESEGLITPARSPSGYRRFGPADVDRLRFILTAQRDQYLPLRVIKERLVGRGPQASQAAAGRSEMVSRRELLDATGIDDAQLAELEAHGLVRRTGRLYGQDALDVATTVAALTSFGLQARHLRTARTAADHQISLIEQVVAPTLRQRSPQARAEAGRTAREIAALLLRLHRAMIESALAEAGLSGGELPGGELHRGELPGGGLRRGELPARARVSGPGAKIGAGRADSGLARRGVGGASA